MWAQDLYLITYTSVITHVDMGEWELILVVGCNIAAFGLHDRFLEIKSVDIFHVDPGRNGASSMSFIICIPRHSFTSVIVYFIPIMTLPSHPFFPFISPFLPRIILKYEALPALPRSRRSPRIFALLCVFFFVFIKLPSKSRNYTWT